jgi:hypothetical protein
MSPFCSALIACAASQGLVRRGSRAPYSSAAAPSICGRAPRAWSQSARLRSRAAADGGGRWSWPRSNGCRGSTTTGCSTPSATFRLPGQRRTTIGNSPVSPTSCRPDLTQRASERIRGGSARFTTRADRPSRKLHARALSTPPERTRGEVVNSAGLCCSSVIKSDSTNTIWIYMCVGERTCGLKR